MEEILNSSSACKEREEMVTIPTELPISVRSPSKREIVNAIKAMKNGKAAGADNIPAEVLKVRYSTPIISRYLADRDVP